MGYGGRCTGSGFRCFWLEQIEQGESSSRCRCAGKEGEAGESVVIALVSSTFGFTTDSGRAPAKIGCSWVKEMTEATLLLFLIFSHLPTHWLQRAVPRARR